jgi:hypothetical protein
MPIETTPFENPFRNLVKNNGDKVKVITNKGKQYQQVVRKKCPITM